MMTALQSLISLAMIFVLVFVSYNTYRVSRLRQNLFEIRGRLFDDAAKGRIDFESSSYIYTRTVLNGMIRFSHRLSLSRFLIGLLFFSPEDRARAVRKVESVFGSSSAADRELCGRYLIEANRNIVRHLGTSPFSFVVALPVVATMYGLLTGASLVAAAVKHCRTLIANVDFLAYQEGRLVLTDDAGHKDLVTRF